MSNILPIERKRFIVKIATARAVAVLLAWLNAGLLVLFGALFVAYALVLSEAKEQQNSLTTLKNMQARATASEVNVDSDTFHKIALKVLREHKLPLSDAIYDFTLLLGDQIIIKNISAKYTQEQDKGILVLAELTARNKEDIMSLIHSLRARKHFEDVDVNKVLTTLQVDNSGAIHFALQLHYRK